MIIKQVRIVFFAECYFIEVDVDDLAHVLINLADVLLVMLLLQVYKVHQLFLGSTRLAITVQRHLRYCLLSCLLRGEQNLTCLVGLMGKPSQNCFLSLFHKWIPDVCTFADNHSVTIDVDTIEQLVDFQSHIAIPTLNYGVSDLWVFPIFGQSNTIDDKMVQDVQEISLVPLNGQVPDCHYAAHRLFRCLHYFKDSASRSKV